MKLQSTAVTENMQKRLRRIEGQTRGIQRMLDEQRDCREIVQQMKAVQSAMKNATDAFVREYAKECLLQSDEMTALDRNVIIDDLMDLMAKI